MYHILCFGDSNTYGYNGETAERFPYEQRWTGILAGLLGPNYRIIEEGLNGRTTGFVEPDKKYRNPIPYLLPCLMSHMPLDLVIVMLGTNDTKPIFKASARSIARSMKKLMLRIRNHLFLTGSHCRILLIPPIQLDRDVLTTDLGYDWNSIDKSAQLEELYQDVAADLGIDYMEFPTFVFRFGICKDGCHFTQQGHWLFAQAVEQKILQLLP